MITLIQNDALDFVLSRGEHEGLTLNLIMSQYLKKSSVRLARKKLVIAQKTQYKWKLEKWLAGQIANRSGESDAYGIKQL